MPQKNKYNLIIFDWDGTIHNSIDIIAETFQEACRDCLLPEPSLQASRYIIGMGVKEAFDLLFPDSPGERYKDLLRAYRKCYLARADSIKLFPGVVETLDKLKLSGYQMAVATGKSRKGLEHAFELTGIRDYFIISRAADECQPKPHPMMVEEILSETSNPPEKSVLIGDTTHDLEMAKNAGIDFISAMYGAHEPEQLTKAGAEKKIWRFSDLQNLL